MRLRRRAIALALSVFAATLLQAGTAFAFSDVPSSYWDYTAIQYVATSHTYMQDYGTSTFKPATGETRELLARALVLAYAPNEKVDPSITFPDLPSSDPFYRYANVATKLGWIPPWGSGNWMPATVVKKQTLDRAVVLAMGLSKAAAGLAAIHQADGDPYTVAEFFPYQVIANSLGLHFNHAEETNDLGALSEMHRDEVAYSLWKALTAQSWQLDDVARFESITLPHLDETQATPKLKQALTEYSFTGVTQPYIWAGEWNTSTGGGYCCGSQPRGGFDCSGFTWWVMKKYEDGYNAAQFHPNYAGWSLPDRSSSQMAEHTPSHITFGKLKIGDLMFFASNGGSNWSDVDHVAIWLGNNWLIHSSGSTDGPTLQYVGPGSYYYDIFVYGRRLIGVSLVPRYHRTEDIRTAGDQN
jgi:hypothetical protein